jgi:hypothetical protein
VNIGEWTTMAILLRDNDYDPDLDATVDPVEDAYWADLALDRESEDVIAEQEVLSQCAICGAVHGDECPDYDWFLRSYFPRAE